MCVTRVSAELLPPTYFSQASQGDNPLGNLQSLLKKLPIGGGGDDDDKMGQADAMQAKAKAYHFDPDNVAPPEVRDQLWELLKWRDNVYRDIIKKTEMISGLSDLIENLTNALNACEFRSYAQVNICAHGLILLQLCTPSWHLMFLCVIA